MLQFIFDWSPLYIDEFATLGQTIKIPKRKSGSLFGIFTCKSEPLFLFGIFINKQFIVNGTMKMMVMRRPSWSTGRLCCSRSESDKLVNLPSDGGGAGLLGDATSVMHQN